MIQCRSDPLINVKTARGLGRCSSCRTGCPVRVGDYELIIPENDMKIPQGYYSVNEIVRLLRDNCNKPEVVYFIADMMEE